MSRIPETWIECTLGNVVDYGAITKVEPDEIPGDAWILELEDIEKDTSQIIQRRTFKNRESKSTKNQFEKGDVLYGKLRPYLNKVVIADSDGFCTTEIIPLKADDTALDSRFLFYWLKHPRFLDYVTSVSHGLNMPRLGTDAGKAAPFVLAPLPEQKRIADKLDAVLGRVDACRTRLARVPDLLKRFRLSVLAAATSGRLTEGWRSDKNSRWATRRLTELGDLGRGKSKHRPRNDPRLYGGDIPFIQTGDVANSGGKIRSHSQTYSAFGLAQSKLWPAETVCITIAANIADTAILTYPACFPDSIVGFVANKEKCVPEFVKWSIDVRRNDLEQFAPATAQKNINLAVLKEVEFECPALLEQQEIVRRVEALFAFADRIESRLTKAQATVDRLSPSTLAKAFRGELVPQDPNDEPASVLLERIRAERTFAGALRPRTNRLTTPATPRAPKENTAMTKSRFDADVKDKPYLAAILRSAPTPLEAAALFQRSELSLVDFYKQLGREVEQGFIKKNREKLEAVA